MLTGKDGHEHTEFTFQYASIKPSSTRRYEHSRARFTFQYASIKPRLLAYLYSAELSFTFQYASIKPEEELEKIESIDNLHFNMLLLNQAGNGVSCASTLYLHFNMLLLNLNRTSWKKIAEDKFTFQYASIKPC